MREAKWHCFSWCITNTSRSIGSKKLFWVIL